MPFAATILIKLFSGRWLMSLGAPGLIVIGLIDNSVIPIPGGMDFFVILLTAHNREWWFYYALMATVGAVLGGYVTYRLAKKGGKEGLEKKIGKKRAEKVYKKFETGGFTTIVVASVIPPPFPLVPVLMAAGILQYSRHKFITALAVGRGIRFFAIAYLGRVYGTAILGWFGQYYKPFLYGLIGLGVVGGIAALWYFKFYRPRHKQDNRSEDERGGQGQRGNSAASEQSAENPHSSQKTA